MSLKHMDGMGIDVDLFFYVSGPAQRATAFNEVIDVVFRHCQANGVALAMPPGSYVLATQLPENVPVPAAPAARRRSTEGHERPDTVVGLLSLRVVLMVSSDPCSAKNR